MAQRFILYSLGSHNLFISMPGPPYSVTSSLIFSQVQRFSLGYNPTFTLPARASNTYFQQDCFIIYLYEYSEYHHVFRITCDSSEGKSGSIENLALCGVWFDDSCCYPVISVILSKERYSWVSVSLLIRWWGSCSHSTCVSLPAFIP